MENHERLNKIADGLENFTRVKIYDKESIIIYDEVANRLAKTLREIALSIK